MMHSKTAGKFCLEYPEVVDIRLATLSRCLEILSRHFIRMVSRLWSNTGGWRLTLR